MTKIMFELRSASTWLDPFPMYDSGAMLLYRLLRAIYYLNRW